MFADSNWQACRYVAGELSADEERVFEGLLAEDQSLREAVARVVEVGDAIRVLESGRDPSTAAAPSRGLSRRERLGWMAGTLAASVLVAVVAVQSLGPRDGEEPSVADRGDRPAATARENADALIALWSAGADDAEIDEDEPVMEETAHESPFDFPDEMGGESGDFTVPGWMLAAVAPVDAEGIDDTSETMPLETPRPAMEN